MLKIKIKILQFHLSSLRKIIRITLNKDKKIFSIFHQKIEETQKLKQLMDFFLTKLKFNKLKLIKYKLIKI